MSEYNWFMSLYFKPRNNLLPELINKDGNRTPLIHIGKCQHLMHLIKDSFLSLDQRPVIVFNGTHSIHYLEKLFVTKRHKALLQTEEIAFYFFEPLTHYVHKNGRDPEMEPHILKIDNEPHEIKNIRCLELESINSWAEKNNIKNLSVYCTDHDCYKHYAQFYPYLKLYEEDLFTSWLCDRISYRSTRNKGWEHDLDSSLITKKFWSGAWRYEPSRHFITAFLVGKDLVKDNNVSFYFKISNSEMKRRMWFGWKEFKLKYPAVSDIVETGNEILQNIVPLSLAVSNPVSVNGNASDPEEDSELDGGNVRTTHDPRDSYTEAFCAIIHESRFTQPWPNISEKTINAINSYRPFVMCAAPGTLQMLKDMGFKTFDKYWPEDYDSIVSNKDRIVKICETIEYINSFSIEELIHMHKDMESILIHNKENFANVQKYYDKLNKKIKKNFH